MFTLTGRTKRVLSSPTTVDEATQAVTFAREERNWQDGAIAKHGNALVQEVLTGVKPSAKAQAQTPTARTKATYPNVEGSEPIYFTALIDGEEYEGCSGQDVVAPRAGTRVRVNTPVGSQIISTEAFSKIMDGTGTTMWINGEGTSSLVVQA